MQMVNRLWSSAGTKIDVQFIDSKIIFHVEDS